MAGAERRHCLCVFSSALRRLCAVAFVLSSSGRCSLHKGQCPAAADHEAQDCVRPLSRDHALLQANYRTSHRAATAEKRRAAADSYVHNDRCPWRGAWEPESHAGCFVVRGSKLLVVELLDGDFNLPGGTYRAGELPACTAWRETKEETGYLTEPVELLQELTDIYQLWHCRVADSEPSSVIDNAEVRRPLWLTSDELTHLPWRFPQVELYKSLLQRLSQDSRGSGEEVEEPVEPSTPSTASTTSAPSSTTTTTTSLTTTVSSVVATTTTTILPTETPDECPYDGHDAPSHAGCFVVNGSKALFVEEWTGQLNLPGGGKLPSEAPQCTAWRRTWQETGFLASPAEHLTTFGPFMVFRCSLTAKADLSWESGAGFDPTVRKLVWMPLDDLTSAHSWRFPDQVSVYRTMLEDVSRTDAKGAC